MKEFDISYIYKYFPDLFPYIFVTLYITLLVVVIGTLLGLILVLGKRSRYRVCNLLSSGYITAIRCTPSIVLLFVVFYGLPELMLGLTGKDINRWNTGIFVVVTFSLMYAGNIAEVMRSAYESIESGQKEAGLSVGLSPFQTFYRIILPQAVYVAIPNVGNSIVSLLKEGSLAFTIGFIDLIGKANLIVSLNYGAHAREVYLGLAALYLILALLLEKLFAVLSEAMGKGRKAKRNYPKVDPVQRREANEL